MHPGEARRRRPGPARQRSAGRGRFSAGWAATVLVLVAGCADLDAEAGGSDDGVGPVVATTSIWADVTRNVACDGAVQVDEIIPVGADAHAFEPSLRDRATLGDAALVVVNGLGLEAGLLDTIAAARDEGTAVFEVGAAMESLEPGAAATSTGGDGETGHAGDGHQHEPGVDPHMWFDPVQVAAVLPALGDALVTHAGFDAAAVAACVAAYQERLADLHHELTEILSVVPADRRKLITNHEALGAFAARYGFELVGTVIPAASTLAETNPADLEALAQLVRDEGVPAIFAETQHSSDEAAALADQIDDVAVVELYTETLGEPGSGAGTYTGLLRTDAALIADALAPDAAGPATSEGR